MIRACPYCEGGCEECGGTGRRVSTGLVVDGAVVVVHGSAPLSAEGEAALASVVRAAVAQMEGHAAA